MIPAPSMSCRQRPLLPLALVVAAAELINGGASNARCDPQPESVGFDRDLLVDDQVVAGLGVEVEFAEDLRQRQRDLVHREGPADARPWPGSPGTVGVRAELAQSFGVPS